MTASEDLLEASSTWPGRRGATPHWRMHALATRLGSVIAPSTDLGGVAILVVDRSGEVIGHAGRPGAIDAAVAAGLGVGADLAAGWSTAAVPLAEPFVDTPIGYLCAAEPDSRVSPMVVAWLRIAAAVIEAEWRLADGRSDPARWATDDYR